NALGWFWLFRIRGMESCQRGAPGARLDIDDPDRAPARISQPVLHRNFGYVPTGSSHQHAKKTPIRRGERTSQPNGIAIDSRHRTYKIMNAIVLESVPSLNRTRRKATSCIV